MQPGFRRNGLHLHALVLAPARTSGLRVIAKNPGGDWRSFEGRFWRIALIVSAETRARDAIQYVIKRRFENAVFPEAACQLPQYPPILQVHASLVAHPLLRL